MITKTGTRHCLLCHEYWNVGQKQNRNNEGIHETASAILLIIFADAEKAQANIYEVE